MTALLTLDAVPADALPLVGGKGLSLAHMIRAGLPVPPGFCVTTDAHRSRALDADAVRAACRALPPGPVAVRSSATAEDGEASSFAGQQETFLGVEGPEAVLDAVRRCWDSLDGERAVAYRRAQGIGDVAMAVVVQALVAADVAGVLFTSDPMSDGKRMLVEASWGLGESVVSGRVVPDRFTLDYESGDLLDSRPGMKAVRRGSTGEEPVPPELHAVPCLDAEQLKALAELGRRVEAYFGGPRDVEWALAGGRFWLLQARPITAAGATEREQVRREEVDALRRRSAPGGTVWSRFNLSESLPAPLPMTWAVVRQRLMSGRGGFGLMYRDLGFDPDPSLDDDGVYDLVCGRPYCNLSREPRLHHRRVPLAHPFRELKADPRRAQYPTPRLDLWRAPWAFWFTWPLELWAMGAAARRQARLLPTFARRYREEIAPPFRRWCAEAPVADGDLLTAFEEAVRRTFVEFARESLKSTALAALCWSRLEDELATVMPRPAAAGLTRDLAGGTAPGPDADYGGAVRALAVGAMTRADFLARFGHRGSDEMELAKPRWVEDPAALDRLGGAGHHAPVASIDERLAACSHLTAQQRPLVVPLVRTLHDYLALREEAKNDLLRGVARVRAVLLELDRRRGLGGGIFYLTPDELPRLMAGEDFGPVVAKRRRRRALALGLECPPVLFSDDLDAIGRPIDVATGDAMDGVPISAGVAEGPALVLESPQPPAGDGYILVCPSTDPAWVPLFVHAAGLVMETGGVLSHGAIVAREFGLPAVAGIAAVTRRIRTGQRVRVDGTRGTVSILG